MAREPPKPSQVSSPAAAPSDVVDFLRAHPPFDALEVADVERVAACAEVEFFLAGTIIFAKSAQPVEHLRVVRTGVVEIVLDEVVLDELGPGELFGVALSWIERPTREQALILVSVLVDSRPVWGIHSGAPVSDTFRAATSRPELLHLLARFALTHRPPTGFLRGLVVEHDGEHCGRLDLKRGGLLPVVDLARWAGMAAGVTSASTLERLHVAGEAGTLPATEVHTLEDAFELFTELRMEHQVEQLRAGLGPDDHVNPDELSALTRSYLKEAFRAVASVQRRIAAELSLGVR